MDISLNLSSSIKSNASVVNKSNVNKTSAAVSDTFVSSKPKSNLSFGNAGKAKTVVKPLTEKYVGAVVDTIYNMVNGKLSKTNNNNALKINTTFKKLLENTPIIKIQENLFFKKYTNAEGNPISKNNSQNIVNKVWEALEKKVPPKTVKDSLWPYKLPGSDLFNLSVFK